MPTQAAGLPSELIPLLSRKEFCEITGYSAGGFFLIIYNADLMDVNVIFRQPGWKKRLSLNI